GGADLIDARDAACQAWDAHAVPAHRRLVGAIIIGTATEGSGRCRGGRGRRGGGRGAGHARPAHAGAAPGAGGAVHQEFVRWAVDTGSGAVLRWITFTCGRSALGAGGGKRVGGTGGAR